jgi:hypothetical protein
MTAKQIKKSYLRAEDRDKQVEKIRLRKLSFDFKSDLLKNTDGWEFLSVSSEGYNNHIFANKSKGYYCLLSEADGRGFSFANHLSGHNCWFHCEVIFETILKNI